MTMTAEVAMHVPDLLIWAGRVITPGGVLRGAVSISGGRITAVEPYQDAAAARQQAHDPERGHANG